MAIVRASEPVERAPTPAVPARDAGAADAGPKSFGDFRITFYYLIVEGEETPRPKKVAVATLPIDASAPPANDGDLADVAPPGPDPEDALVPLYEGRTCNVIAQVSKSFYAELALQGSGQLKDGRVLNVFGRCKCDGASSCFQVARSSKWGFAGTGRPLSPYRTVAVDPKVVPLGTLLYIPLLDGIRMPGEPPTGGFVHDGCVVADDTGGMVSGKQIDLFVGRKAYFMGLARRHGMHGHHEWANNVPVYDGSGRCTRQGGRVSRSAAGSI